MTFHLFSVTLCEYFVQFFLCLFLFSDRTGSWKTDPGQEEVLGERGEGERERGEEGGEEEEIQLSGDHEVSGGITFIK